MGLFSYIGFDIDEGYLEAARARLNEARSEFEQP